MRMYIQYPRMQYGPHLNSVFCRRKLFSFPWYRFCVRFSVDTTRAVLLGRAWSRCLAKSMARTPALQP